MNLGTVAQASEHKETSFPRQVEGQTNGTVRRALDWHTAELGVTPGTMYSVLQPHPRLLGMVPEGKARNNSEHSQVWPPKPINRQINKQTNK